MKRILIGIGFTFLSFAIKAQIASVNGYLKDMQGIYIFENHVTTSAGNKISNISYNLLHNRLNFKLYPSGSLTLALELRNRMFSGQLLKQIPTYATSISTDNGLIDLSWNWTKQDNYLINTAIDRAYIDYTMGNWQLRAGRHRINWGINFVWNPNDIFNAFSYMDFDYEERPGSDAILVTWYPTMSSSVDVAYKAASSIENSALAVKYRFNKFNYDFQILAGQSGVDYVLGGGWSGNIQNIGFRGEASYFKPINNYKSQSEEGVSVSVSLDYNFENSLYVHTSFLFNSLGSTEKGESFSLIDPNIQLSAKKLSIGKYEWFGQVSYPIGTLFNVSGAAMINPVDRSMFVGPSVSVSLQNNLELFLTSQLMLGESGTEYAAMGNLYALFGRLRWSF